MIYLMVLIYKYESYAKHTNTNPSCHTRNLQSREVEQMKSKAKRQPDSFPMVS
jgi:hypothetical protein